MTDPKWFEKVDKSAGAKRARVPKAIYRKIIRKMCVHCCGGMLKEVENCPANDCPLWPARMGTPKLEEIGPISSPKLDHV